MSSPHLAITCNVPQDGDKFTVLDRDSLGATITKGDKLTYQCKDKYEPKEDQVAECLETGELSIPKDAVNCTGTIQNIQNDQRDGVGHRYWW